MPLILAIDQSTSATKVLLFNQAGQCLDRESRQHAQHYPNPGWVEHNAEEIWQNLIGAVQKLVGRNPEKLARIVALSITNQRETVVVFDPATGVPLYPAIVWQCRRSDDICASHIAKGHSSLVHSRTGLRIDAYFSASKLQWMIEHFPELKAKLQTGQALIGTIDTYLIYRLTSGKVFATDHTNASRTLLFDIRKLVWDQELCDLWGVPSSALPEVRSSDAAFGLTDIEGILRQPIPIVGVMGDSQASLFAQGCYDEGNAKVTFGTGSSILLNIGTRPQFSDRGLVTALAWVRAGVPIYAFEGIVIHSAATLHWLITQLELLTSVEEMESVAQSIPDTGGVYLVPAFSGLGFPHWQANARAAIVGLSGYSDKRHIVRAALESISYQLKDALDVMQEESGVQLKILMADGGPTTNKFLMQFTANMTQTNLVVSDVADCSALGASFMGLIGVGVYPSADAISKLVRNDQVYPPKISPSVVKTLDAGWQRAVRQVLAGII